MISGSQFWWFFFFCNVIQYVWDACLKPDAFVMDLWKSNCRNPETWCLSCYNADEYSFFSHFCEWTERTKSTYREWHETGPHHPEHRRRRHRRWPSTRPSSCAMHGSRSTNTGLPWLSSRSLTRRAAVFLPRCVPQRTRHMELKGPMPPPSSGASVTWR